MKKEASEYLRLAFQDAQFAENFESIIERLDKHFSALRMDLKQYEEFVEFLKQSKVNELNSAQELSKQESEQEFKSSEAKKDRKLKIWLVIIPLVAGGTAAIWKFAIPLLKELVK